MDDKKIKTELEEETTKFLEKIGDNLNPFNWSFSDTCWYESIRNRESQERF